MRQSDSIMYSPTSAACHEVPHAQKMMRRAICAGAVPEQPSAASSQPRLARCCVWHCRMRESVYRQHARRAAREAAQRQRCCTGPCLQALKHGVSIFPFPEHLRRRRTRQRQGCKEGDERCARCWPRSGSPTLQGPPGIGERAGCTVSIPPRLMLGSISSRGISFLGAGLASPGAGAAPVTGDGGAEGLRRTRPRMHVSSDLGCSWISLSMKCLEKHSKRNGFLSLPRQVLRTVLHRGFGRGIRGASRHAAVRGTRRVRLVRGEGRGVSD